MDNCYVPRYPPAVPLAANARRIGTLWAITQLCGHDKHITVASGELLSTKEIQHYQNQECFECSESP